MKIVNSLWPPDLPGRALVIAFLALPVLFAILTGIGWQQTMPIRVPTFVVGAWLIVIGVLLAVPSPMRASPPRLVNLGMLLGGAGCIAIGVASTRPDFVSFALLELGGLLLAIVGLLLAGSTALSALSGERG